MQVTVILRYEKELLKKNNVFLYSNFLILLKI